MQFPDLDFNADEIDTFDSMLSTDPLAAIEHRWEHWRPLKEVPGCRVSNFGRVERRRTNRFGKTRTWVTTGGRNNKGYRQIGLEGRTVSVHKLVTAAFIGPCPPGKEINHKDGNRENNMITNLEYVTRAENIRHAVERGKQESMKIWQDAPIPTRSEACG